MISQHVHGPMSAGPPLHEDVVDYADAHRCFAKLLQEAKLLVDQRRHIVYKIQRRLVRVDSPVEVYCGSHHLQEYVELFLDAAAFCPLVKISDINKLPI